MHQLLFDPETLCLRVCSSLVRVWEVQGQSNIIQEGISSTDRFKGQISAGSGQAMGSYMMHDKAQKMAQRRLASTLRDPCMGTAFPLLSTANGRHLFPRTYVYGFIPGGKDQLTAA